MSKNLKRILSVSLTFLLCLGVGLTFTFGLQTKADSSISTSINSPQINNWNSLTNMNSPAINGYSFAHFSRNIIESDSALIPGLDVTHIIDQNGNNVACHDMVPQGVCVVEDYMLISAYCSESSGNNPIDHHSSVLYVLKDGKYCETITLMEEDETPFINHVGGLAYLDGTVYLAGSNEKCVYRIDYYSLISALDNKDASRVIVSKAFNTVKDPYNPNNNKTASFITEFQGKLYVGTFYQDNNTPTHNTSIQAYTPTNKGYEVSEEIILPTNKGQGIAFYEREDGIYLFVSSSHGRVNPSELISIKWNGENVITDEQVFRTIEMPNMSEDLFLSGNKLWIAFESGAKEYLHSDAHPENLRPLDRVICINPNFMVDRLSIGRYYRWDNNRYIGDIYSSGDYEYVIYNKEEERGLISKYIGSDSNIEIPSIIDGIIIDKIGYRAFSECSVESVVIPDGINYIEAFAFSECSSIQTVKLPKKVQLNTGVFAYCTSLQNVTFPSEKYINDRLFEGCSSLKSISIPDNLTYIGFSAFSGCSSLQSINIPESVEDIGKAAFSGCTSLRNINIPKNVKDLDHTFSGCTSLQSVTIPDTFERIGQYVFEGCTSLQSIIIPDSIKTIGTGAFSGCTSLQSVILPNSITSMDYAFAHCTSLQKINIPESIEELSSTFEGCSSLKSIVIPDNVKRIGAYAFSGCSSLKSINLPDSVESIGSAAFSGCTSLLSMQIPEGVPRIESETFNSCSSLQTIILPSTLNTIKSFAFNGCKSLLNIVIPNNVKSIENCAFYECTSLENIILSEGLENIGDHAFYKCEVLKSITIPKGVVKIEPSTFEYCYELKRVTLPDGIEEIGKFAFDGCYYARIDLYGCNAPTVDSIYGLGGEEVHCLYNASGYTVEDNVWKLAGRTVIPDLGIPNAELFCKDGSYLKTKMNTVLGVREPIGGEYEFKFIVYNTTTKQWYKLQDFSDMNTCNWYSGPAGVKNLYVDIRNKAYHDDITRIALTNVNVTEKGLSVTSFTSSESNEVAAKTYTTLAAEAIGGTSPYEYKFIVHNEDSGQWYKIQDFSSKNTSDWYTGPAANKTLYVDVRDADGTVVRKGLSVIVK